MDYMKSRSETHMATLYISWVDNTSGIRLLTAWRTNNQFFYYSTILLSKILYNYETRAL
jgi:hypothetical protein